MKVTKRNGQTEEVRFDKVTRRLNALCDDLPNVQTSDITHSVVQNMYDEIPTSQVDELSADTAMTFAWKEPENEKLAIRLLCDNIRKMAPKSFWLSSRRLHDTGLMDDALFQWIKENKEELNDIVQSERDTDLTFFGLKTLVKSYLVSVDGSLLETPQYMWLRVSCSVHWPHMEDVKQSYEYMSKGYYTHATPTLFNAGSKRPQCSSCYLMGIHDDSLSDIYKTVGDVAQVSKWAGGVGLHVSHIRAKGSKIRGTNGRSDGIIPMLRVFNNTARYVNQGGKRKGSIAIYLEPWHADVLDFLELRLNEGDPEARCRDLFLALWVPDLFMKRLEQQGEWSLFCPDECPGLNNVWGQEFEDLYERYEREGKARATIPITKLWQAVVKSQVETGTPYVLYKDTCNRQSNQKNLGTLKCSNLCAEIQQFTAPDEVAVCNLASVALPKFVKEGELQLDHLREVARFVTRALDRVIDRNFYPTKEAQRSNQRHRPIGIGVQGLADVFHKLKVAFDSPPARKANRDIFETMYYGALQESAHLARTIGPYETFEGSPAHQGQFQWDMSTQPDPEGLRWDWEALRAEMMGGLRNSLLLAPMPTASTAQILGNNECFEPYTSNVYLRRTMAGEFVVVNKFLVDLLKERRQWNQETRDRLVAHGGSIQDMPDLFTDEERARFKTVWELSMRTVIDMASDRQQFICQSQSMNLFVADPTNAKVSSMLMYGWKKGLKTGMYYLRTRPKARAQQFTLDPTKFGNTNCASCSA